jgi:lysophospholipase L1-like esterase
VRKSAGAGGRLLKTAWLIIGATLLLILFLEVACGLIYQLLPAKTGSFYFPHSQVYKNAPWSEDYDKELIASYNTTWRPFVYWRRAPLQGKYININAQGLRYTAPGELRAGEVSRQLKIFMFGGSTMWGEGVRDQYTLPSLVAQDLAARKIKADITNFGEVAYVNTQELIELIFQLERGNIPDVVIFYDGFNDVYAAAQNQVAGFSQFEWKRELEYNISTRYNKLRNVFLLNSLDRFYLGKLIKSLSEKLSYKKPFSQASKTLEKDIVEVYLNNIKIVHALGKAYGFLPLFFWQPVIYTKNSLTDSEKPYATEPLGQLYHQAHTVMQADAAAFAPYNFIDISNLFAGAQDEVYLDFSHVHEDANRLIAQRLTGDLLKIIEKHPHLGREGISGSGRPGRTAP